MHNKRLELGFLVIALAMSACSPDQKASEASYERVDKLFGQVLVAASDYTAVVDIDHSRLAAEEGVFMPPARVYLFSDSKLNTALLLDNPMLAIDLPFKILTYEERGQPRVIATTAEFLQRRHGVEDSAALVSYQQKLDDVLGSIPQSQMASMNLEMLTKGYGLEALSSPYPFEKTIQKLKSTILAESDTVWFTQIHFHEDARSLGVPLPKLTLLLFGGPAPGGKAMADYPRLGLDAFCQKVLVREHADGRIDVYYNNIGQFAELHYGQQAMPHRIITYRLSDTLGSALK